MDELDYSSIIDLPKTRIFAAPLAERQKMRVDMPRRNCFSFDPITPIGFKGVNIPAGGKRARAVVGFCFKLDMRGG